MSKSSYVPVRFVGGPLGGTSKDYAGEPKRVWTPKDGGLGGAYAFEWDRSEDGTKLRSGVYTWDTDTEAAPASGDAASALMDELGPEKAAQRLAPRAPMTARRRRPGTTPARRPPRRLRRRRPARPPPARPLPAGRGQAAHAIPLTPLDRGQHPRAQACA
jgi:hypothetical protein